MDNNNLKNRIVIIRGSNDCLGLIEEQYYKAFADIRCDTYLFDMREPDFRGLLEYAKDGVSLVLTCVHDGLATRLENGLYVFDLLNAPIFDILMDHPYWTTGLDNLPANTVICCLDRNHVNWLVDVCKYNHPVVFLPHAGVLPDNNDKPIAERNIDILYVGSLKKAPNSNGPHTEYIMDELKRNPAKTLEEVLAELSGTENLQEMAKQYWPCDININTHFRYEAVRLLVEAGYDVQVYGGGWELPELLKYPNYHFGGCITAMECVQLMTDSKIVLNSMPWFKDGNHDRIINAMLSKAVCVTDTSKYLEESFEDDCDLKYFHLEEIEKLPKIVGELLQDTVKMQNIADAGYEKAIAAHTYASRAKWLLGLL